MWTLLNFLGRGRWWSEDTVAIVTGANKGIGFALVKRMAELGVTVILTARDIERGCKAVEALRAQGLYNVAFSCLDVSDPSSIRAFASWFRKSYAALDILVILSFLFSTIPFQVNYFTFIDHFADHFY